MSDELVVSGENEMNGDARAHFDHSHARPEPTRLLSHGSKHLERQKYTNNSPVFLYALHNVNR